MIPHQTAADPGRPAGQSRQARARRRRLPRVPRPPRGRGLVLVAIPLAVAVVATLVWQSGVGRSSPGLKAAAVAATTSTTTSIWDSSVRPAHPVDADTRSVEVGVRFRTSVAGFVTGIRYYRGSTAGGGDIGSLWDAAGRRLGTVAFTGTGTGWQQASLTHPVRLVPGEVYIASYRAAQGRYASDSGYFRRSVVSGPLQAEMGVFSYQYGVPRSSYHDTNYYVDVVFRAATTPVSGATASPAAGTSSTTWPGPSNTGVPRGTTLRTSASFVVTRDNTVIDGLDVTGPITIRAHNVTIKNTRVRGCGPNGAIDTGFDKDGFGPVLITDVEVDGQDNCDVRLIGSDNYTAIRVNAHGGRTGFGADTNVTIKDSWVHDLWYKPYAHQDAILSNGGSHYLFQHNNLECTGGWCSGSIGLFGDFGPISDVAIVDNLLNTNGSYCLYAGSVSGKDYPHASDVRVLNNQFGRKFEPRCGIYGPVTGFEPGRPGSQWSGNTWQGDGTVVSPGS